jgi:hypothetical protein
MAEPENPQDRDLLRFMSAYPETKKKIEKNIPYDFRVAVPSVSIMPGTAQSAPDAYGYVMDKLPDTIFINPKMDAGKFPQLMAHEMEHVLQNNVAKRYDSTYDKQIIDEMAKMTGGNRAIATDQITASLEKSAQSTKLAAHIQNQYKIDPSQYIGGMNKDSYSLQEQWAELSSLEQVLKKDLTKDKMVQQEFFNGNQALIDVYKATTGLRTTRLDAKDLPPMTVPPASKQSPAPKKSNNILDMSVKDIIQTIFGSSASSTSK